MVEVMEEVGIKKMGKEERVEVTEEGLEVNGILFGSAQSFLCFIFC